MVYTSYIVLIGRGIMLLAGIATPPDVYTASIGIYVLWMLGRTLSSVTSLCSKGNLCALSTRVVFWVNQVSFINYEQLIIFL